MSEHHIVKSSLLLGKGSLLRIADGRDLVLYVRSGAVWVTQEKDPRDRYLHAGDWFTVSSAGLTLVSALRAGALALASPHHEGAADRIDVLRASTGRLEPVYAPPPGLAGRLAMLRTRLAQAWAGWFAVRSRPTTASL
jgi:hypothetical protein